MLLFIFPFIIVWIFLICHYIYLLFCIMYLRNKFYACLFYFTESIYIVMWGKYPAVWNAAIMNKSGCTSILVRRTHRFANTTDSSLCLVKEKKMLCEMYVSVPSTIWNLYTTLRYPPRKHPQSQHKQIKYWLA